MRKAVDPSLGYWLGPSATPEHTSNVPVCVKTPTIPHDARALDSDLATSPAARPRISDDGQMTKDCFSYDVKITYSGDPLPGNSLQYSILDSAHIIDEESTRTLDPVSPSPLPRYRKAPSTSSSPPADPDAPSPINCISVERFLRAQSRKPAKRRNYKRRPKVTTKSDLERLKETDSSFAREEDQLLSDNDDDPLAPPTKQHMKAQSAGDHQMARKRRRTRKTEGDTNAGQPLELQERSPNIATRSLHERWHLVDPRKGRPFVQPTFATGQHRPSLRLLKPPPVPPLKWTDNGPSDCSHDPQDVSLTTKVPGKRARPSARMTLSMEPTEEHERKLKTWKRSVRHSRRAFLISLSAIMFKSPL